MRGVQTVHHQVEDVAEEPDLVPRVDPDRARQIPLDHSLSRRHELTHRSRHLPGDEHPRADRQQARDQGVQPEPAAHRLQLHQVHVGAEVDLKRAHRLLGPVPDRREGGDPAAVVARVDAGEAGLPLPEHPPEHRAGLGREPIRLADLGQPVADHPVAGGVALDVREGVDRVAQLVRFLDQQEAVPQGQVLRRVVPARPHHLLVGVPIDQEGPGARDVEQQAPERFAEEPLLRPVLQQPADQDPDRGEQQHRDGQAPAEPSPDGQARAPRRGALLDRHRGASRVSTLSSETSRSKNSSTVQSRTTRSRADHVGSFIM